MRNLYLIFVLIMLTTAVTIAPASGAEREPDTTVLWTELTAGARLTRGLSLDLTHHLRRDDSFSRLTMAGPEVTARYRLLSWVRLETGFRYMHKRDNEGDFHDRQRVYAGTRLRARFWNMGFALRARYRQETRAEEDDGTTLRNILRLRGKTRYRGWDRAQPFLTLESFMRMDDHDEDIPEYTLTKWRAMAGVDFDWQDWEITLRYGLDIPVHDEEAPLEHIVSVGLKMDLVR